ncbi:uncharacterized protein [Nicotiana sylvestris]|uniref:uncharacterized protein n=1 Tax=Nicotiana sylvestris TaxID=4096 RepID=UPI00388C4786
MARNEVSSLDHNHPLFLQAKNTPGLVLIPIKLTELENYALCSRATKLALRGKGKLGFVDGSSTKRRYRGELVEQWEKYNMIVLSWIGSTVSNKLMPGIVYASDARKVLNNFPERFDRSNLTRIYHLWAEIATMRQGTNSVTSYYTKMKDLWDELDEESSRTLCVVDTHRDPLTMLPEKTQGFKPKSTGLIYEHCGYKSHLKENCYKIVEYPQDFKSKKKAGQFGGNTGQPGGRAQFSGGFIPYANNATTKN